MSRYDRTSYYIPTPRRVRSPQHQWHMAGITTTIAVLVLLVLGIASCQHFEYGTEHLVTFTIASKDDQASGNNHQYLIFTRGGHTFKDADAWFHGKLNSSDVWAGLHTGQRYTCDVYGWLLGLIFTVGIIIAVVLAQIASWARDICTVLIAIHDDQQAQGKAEKRS